MILQNLWVFLLMMIINGLVVLLSKKTFGKCMPVTMVTIIIVLYGSQYLFHTFTPGYILASAAIPAFLVLLYKYRRNKDEIGKNLFSYGFYGFIAIFVIFLVIDFHRPLCRWDELSHWGMMVKEMLRTNHFYTDEGSHLIAHREYPPFVALFEMFWCHMAGGYSEMSVSLGLHMMLTSIGVLPILDILEQRQKSIFYKCGYGFLVTILFVAVVNTFDTDVVLTTIYSDIVMFVIFAYAMYLVAVKEVYKEEKGYVSFVLMLIMLPMTKQIGLPLLLLAVAYYFLLGIIRRRPQQETGNYYVKHIGKAVLALLIPLVVYKSWTIHVKNLGLVGQFDLDQISVQGIMEVMRGSNDTLQHQTMINYLTALFQRPIYSNVITITVVSTIFVVWLVIFLMWYFAGKRKHVQDTFTRREALTLAGMMTIGKLGYCITMMVLYMFCFTQVEMIGLASYDRYMSSYFIGEILLLVMIACHLFRGQLNQKRMLVLTLVVLVISNPVKLYNLVPQVVKGSPYTEFENEANQMKAVATPGSKFFVVADSVKDYQFYIAYYANEMVIDMDYYDLLALDLGNEEIISAIKQQMSENDYVYVIHSTEAFQNAMGDLSEKPYQENTIYKVDTSGTAMKLTAVE